MPKFQVTSGENLGSNGHQPPQKIVDAQDFDEAASQAPTFGRGKIKTVTPMDYDKDNSSADYLATTTKDTSFKVVVKEIR